MSKILIIDDDKKILFSFKHKLSNIGFDILTAENATEGLKCLKQNQDIDLILLDYMMPDMDGLETFSEIKNHSIDHPPVIMMTFNTDYKIATKFILANGTDFVEKNINPNELKIKIERAIYYAKHKKAETELKVTNQLLLEKTNELKIQNQKLTEQAEQLLIANKELQQFTDFVAHDLKEPLRNISNSLQFIKWDFSDKIGGQASEYINFAINGAVRLNHMIKGLTNFANVNETIDYQEVFLSEIIKETLENLSLQISENDAIIELIGINPEVIGEKYQLIQLFQNLISNAIKFKKTTEIPHIIIDCQPSNDFWEFSLSDNGIGFDETYSKRIFNIFQRLHSPQEYQGSGIGLSICKKIITRHKGEISVSSKPKIGTIFKFSISKHLV
jgi:signal transduction histidine kinase